MGNRRFGENTVLLGQWFGKNVVLGQVTSSKSCVKLLISSCNNTVGNTRRSMGRRSLLVCMCTVCQGEVTTCVIFSGYMAIGSVRQRPPRPLVSLDRFQLVMGIGCSMSGRPVDGICVRSGNGYEKVGHLETKGRLRTSSLKMTMGFLKEKRVESGADDKEYVPSAF